MTKKILTVCFSLFAIYSHAQSADFCTAMNTIMNDAPNQFRNVRGTQNSITQSAIIWDCNIPVPGVTKARFVAAMGLFYEGAVFQTKTISDLKPIYDSYKSKLDSCFSGKGYTISLADNFYPGLADYKKVAYLPQVTDETTVDNAPSHIAMEVDYDKANKTYSIVLYIFQH